MYISYSDLLYREVKSFYCDDFSRLFSDAVLYCIGPAFTDKMARLQNWQENFPV